MEQSSIHLDIRKETGKGFARRLRRTGKLPGVVYGLGHNTTVSVEERAIYRYLMAEGGRNKVLTIDEGDLKGRHVLIKDYQVDPVSRKLIHVDLIEIDVSKKIEVIVKLNFVGKAAGVADGGVLNILAREVAIKCLPNQIPEHLDVDVSALKIADSIHLDEVKFPEGIERTGQGNLTLVACVPPTKEEEAVAVLAPTAAPEVITEKKPAEGEAAATGKDEKKK